MNPEFKPWKSSDQVIHDAHTLLIGVWVFCVVFCAVWWVISPALWELVGIWGFSHYAHMNWWLLRDGNLINYFGAYRFPPREVSPR